jgi:hypothetical protein
MRPPNRRCTYPVQAVVYTEQTVASTNRFLMPVPVAVCAQGAILCGLRLLRIRAIRDTYDSNHLLDCTVIAGGDPHIANVYGRRQ